MVVGKGQTKSKCVKVGSSQRFFQKNKQTNSTLLLWYLRSTCFRLFIGRNWRHQNEISKSSDIYAKITQSFENDTVLCFSDFDWKTVEYFCTTVSKTVDFLLLPNQKQVDPRYHSSKVEFVRLFFWRKSMTPKKPFRN